MTYAPVDPPPRLAPTVGLIASTNPVEQDGRWMAGLSFQPETCSDGAVTYDECGDGTPPSKTIDDPADVVNYKPVILWHGDYCSAGTDDVADRARRGLIQRRSALLAAELWDGSIAQDAGYPNNYLASNSASDATPVDGVPWIVDGYAILAAALASAEPGRGMMHVTRRAATLLAANDVIHREGKLLVDPFDNIVIADAGYSGNGPSGAPAEGTTWMYATTPVVTRLSELKTIPSPDRPWEAVNRDDNLVEYRAEQVAAAYWDGCAHYAINVTLTPGCVTVCADE